MIHSKRYANSLHGGIAMMQARDGNESFLLPLKTVRLTGKIGGPVGELSVTHTFSISEGEISGPVEAVYRFPLPGDAAVRSMTVIFGETVLKTELKPRDEAARTYAHARGEGHDAALLMRESFDAYSLRISGLRPGQDVSVTTHYIQMGDHDGEGFSFRLPLTIAPRFQETYKEARGTSTLLCNPSHTLSIDVKRECGVLESPTHRLFEQDDSLSIADEDVKCDHDLIIRWRPADDGMKSMVMVGKGRRKPFVALVAPEKEGKGLPRDVIILVDHSGSMSGSKWEAADWAVERFLSSLRPDDVFNLCLFHSDTKWLSPIPLNADKGNIDDAKKFFKDGSKGGTRLRMAIEEALQQPRAEGDVSRHLLTITDGQIHDTEETLRTIDRESKRKDSRRCSVICIDSAPNDFLSRQIAHRSGGTVHFLTSNPKEGDITTALDGILDTFSTPLATGLLLKTDRGTSLSKKGGDEHLSPLPDMVPGRVNFTMGLLSAGKGRPCFSLNGRSLPVMESETVNALFAAMRINEMEILKGARVASGLKYCTLRGLGFTPAALRKQLEATGAEDWRAMDRIIKGLIIDESLKGGVVSSETALFVKGNEGQRVVASVDVPNAWPQGWDEPLTMNYESIQMKQYDHLNKTASTENGLLCMSVYGIERVRSEYSRTPWQLFDGHLLHKDGSVILFHGTFPGHGVHRFTSLTVYRDGNGGIAGSLLLHIGDLCNPRVSVDLRDLERAGGIRPVNLVISPGDEVKVTIVSGQGLEGLRMEVMLS